MIERRKAPYILAIVFDDDESGPAVADIIEEIGQDRNAKRRLRAQIIRLHHWRFPGARVKYEYYSQGEHVRSEDRTKRFKNVS